VREDGVSEKAPDPQLSPTWDQLDRFSQTFIFKVYLGRECDHI
jgi:hypothetical protein